MVTIRLLAHLSPNAGACERNLRRHGQFGERGHKAAEVKDLRHGRVDIAARIRMLANVDAHLLVDAHRLIGRIGVAEVAPLVAHAAAHDVGHIVRVRRRDNRDQIVGLGRARGRRLAPLAAHARAGDERLLILLVGNDHKAKLEQRVDDRGGKGQPHLVEVRLEGGLDFALFALATHLNAAREQLAVQNGPRR